MKKRVLSLLMSVVMLVSLLPATARAADQTGDISVGTPEELQALGGQDIKGNITLTADIHMSKTSMAPIKSLTGTFNGQGHVISDLTLTGQAGGGVRDTKYTALIGTLNSGTVKNLKLDGITVSADSAIANYNHLSTLIAYVNAGDCTIEDCVVTGSVTYDSSSSKTNSNYISGLIGQVFGYDADPVDLKIKNCTVDVTVAGAKKDYAAGLVATAGAVKASVENCAVLGNITADSSEGYAGGLLGLTSTSSEFSFTNCYYAGSISGDSFTVRAFAFMTKSGNRAGTINYTNCYYDTSLNTKLKADSRSDYGNTKSIFNGQADGKTTDGLKALKFDGFVTNESGYPVPEWTPAVPPAPQFSCTLVFENTEGGTLVVKHGEEILAPNNDGQYMINETGDNYSYKVTFGEGAEYEDVPETQFAVYDSDNETTKKITVKLERIFSGTLTFTGTENGTLTVCDPEGNVVPANEDGSYTLSSAGSYTYTLTFDVGSIYSDITDGSFTVLKTETEKTVAVELSYKTAQPSGDGTEESPYLIGTAEELRWFAQRVNALDTAAAKAYVKLTKNIEVPGSWTPLGKKAVYPFSGHFDGDGHSVTITVKDPDLTYFGFFGCLDSKVNRDSTTTPIDGQPTVVVENLTVNGTIYCSEPGAFVGGIAARAMGKVELKNCVNNATISSSAASSAGVGGLVGGYEDGVEYVYENIRMTVDGCTNNGTITVTGDNEKAYVGGLVGSNKNCTQVKDSANTGTVNAPGCTVGGLLGQAGSQTGGFAPSIEDSGNTGVLIGAEGKTNNLFGEGTVRKDNIKNSGDNVYEGGEITDPLLLEAMKYNEVVAVPANAQAGDVVDAIKDDRQPVGTITVTYSQGEKDTNRAYLKVVDRKLLLAKENTTGKVIQATATITWTMVNDGTKTLSKPVTVNIYPAAKGEISARKALMEAIAKTYRNKSEDWVVFDMAVYEASGLGKNTTNIQNYLNLTVNALVDDKIPSVTDRAKGEIILAALGIDSTKLKSLSGVEYSNAQKLAEMDFGTSYYTAPWVLLAEQAGQLELTDEQRSDMIALLTDSKDLNADGLFTSAWGTKTYLDVDTTATALNALVKYNTDKYPEVQGFITKAVAGLSKAQGSDGSYGNVNSDAMVILGLLSVGIDPAKDARFVKGGCSLADALLLYVNSSSNGFVVAGAGTGEQGDKARALATEQGFRALVALEKYAVLSGENEGTVRYNIYTLTGEIVKENGTTETKPEQPSPDKGFDSDKPGTPDDSSTGGNTGGSTGGETKSISVHVTVRTNDAQWVSGDYTITKGQSALDALQKALKANGITCQTKDSQYGTYVRSLTRNGETLGELDQGPNSGWMYQINGKTPMVSIDAYGMEGGDKLLFYYVADYTKEDAGGSLSGGGQTKELPFTDVVDTSWFYAAVQYVWEKGLMTGMDGKTFSPESTTTRAQLVTILWQLAGCPDSESSAAYSDAQASAWYAKAVAWAGANGIVSGYADGSFGPDDAVTREQFAAILYRYAQSLGEGFTGSWYFLLDYSDAQQISAWADEAMHWCVMKGILSGTGADTLSPGMSTTRGQMAVMLMQFCQRNEK